jgi:hypothetical protein
MFSPPGNVTYQRCWRRRWWRCSGTGLATVARGLLAHRPAGARAGESLGIALAIKMVACVAVAPFASALSPGVEQASHRTRWRGHWAQS